MARYPGKGAELRMGDGEPTEAFTKIAQLIGFNFGGFQQNTESAIDNDAPEHAEVHVETTKNYGNVPFTAHWDPAETTHGETSAGLLGRFQTGGIRNYQAAWPGIAGQPNVTFAASIENLAPPSETQVDGKLVLTGQFKISGVPDWGNDP